MFAYIYINMYNLIPEKRYPKPVSRRRGSGCETYSCRSSASWTCSSRARRPPTRSDSPNLRILVYPESYFTEYTPVYKDQRCCTDRVSSGHSGEGLATALQLAELTCLSLYTSILGDIWLWVGVPWAFSALVVPSLRLSFSWKSFAPRPPS